MAYHDVCKDLSGDSNYSLIPESRFPGTCAAGVDCKKDGNILKGQPIWYFKKQSSGQSTRSESMSSVDVDQLSKQIKELQRQLRQLQDEINRWIVFEASVGQTVDWRKLPKLDKSSTSKEIATPQDAADIFSGSDVFEVA